jgi:hypothetical protein
VLGALAGKEVYMDNARLLITNKGRMGLWHNYQGGSETGCCCCKTTFVKSQTTVKWYHVSDIAYTQISYARRYRFICCVLVEGAMFRVVFKKFPSMASPWVVSVPGVMAPVAGSPSPKAVNSISGTFVRARCVTPCAVVDVVCTGVLVDACLSRC